MWCMRKRAVEVEVLEADFVDETRRKSATAERTNCPASGWTTFLEDSFSFVEYALSRTMSPVMVAQYKKQLIPKEVLQRTFEEYLALPETIPENDGDGLDDKQR